MSRGRPRGLKGILWGAAADAAGFRIPCHWCGSPLTYAEATVDHEPPLAEGGTRFQVVIACDGCNQARSRVTNETVKGRRKKGKRGRHPPKGQRS